jgi:hypothetical protein
MFGFVARGRARWRRAIVAAFVSSAFLIALLPGTTLAGSPTTFFVFLGGECLEGTTNPDRSFEVTIKDPNGRIKIRDFVQSDGDGFWSICFGGRVDTGDTVRTSGTGSDRSITVPQLTMLTNRVSNEVWGKGPANSTVDLFLETCKTFSQGSCSEKLKTVSTAPDGSYQTTFNGPNPRGGDFISATWFSAQGDLVQKSMTFENLSVALGGFERGRFFGSTNEGAGVDLELRHGNALRGTGKATGDDFGGFRGRFRMSGVMVYPDDGDRVTGTLATDLNLTIPAVNLQPNVNNDHVSGRCFANKAFEVVAEGQGGFSIRQGKAGSNGNFNVDMSAGDFADYEMQDGDLIFLRCRNAQGDEITHEKVVGGPLSAPANLSGSGNDIEYSVRFGYNGPFSASPRGLVPAETDDGAVTQGDGATFDINVPAGTTLARFALFDEETDGFHDLDLIVRFGGEEVGGSFGPVSNERVDLHDPEPGTYEVEVFGFFVDGAEANFTLFSWAVGSSGTGNMTVSEPATASDGETGTIELSFSGLAADTRYLGTVAYSGTAGLPDPTVVSVNTP